jgi:hypothetical protein
MDLFIVHRLLIIVVRDINLWCFDATTDVMGKDGGLRLSLCVLRVV